jgi:hypothetical protein
MPLRRFHDRGYSLCRFRPGLFAIGVLGVLGLPFPAETDNSARIAAQSAGETLNPESCIRFRTSAMDRRIPAHTTQCSFQERPEIVAPLTVVSAC